MENYQLVDNLPINPIIDGDFHSYVKLPEGILWGIVGIFVGTMNCW